MSTHGEHEIFDEMLWQLVETTWTLTRMVAQRRAERPHSQATHPAAGSHGEDIPVESTANVPHVGEGDLRESEPIIPSFDPLPPGKLGAEVLKLATAELGRPVKEQYKGSQPSNIDTGGHIKKYFIEGPCWKEEKWQSYTNDNHGIGPAWCAAFASFCWHGAHRALGVVLPVKLSAQCSVLCEQAKKVNRFIPPTEKPAPGDMVLLGSDGSPHHVGLVEKVDPDGIIHIIEGNAGENTDQLCRSRLIPGRPRYAKLVGFVSLEPRPNT